MKSLVLKAPARLRVHGPGQGVDHDVGIGRDMQPMHDNVITGVDDDRKIGARHHAREPVDEQSLVR